MKNFSILIFCLLYNGIIIGQPNKDSINIDFLKQKKTYLINYKDFVFQSNEMGMRYVYTKDSSVFYDGVQKNLLIFNLSKDTGFNITLHGDTIIIIGYKSGKRYNFTQDIDSDIGQRNTRLLNIEGVSVVLYYINKKIRAISIYHINNKNFNLVLNRNNETKILNWDLLLEIENYNNVNLISDKTGSKIGAILLTTQSNIEFSNYKKSTSGLEILNKESSETNWLSKIRVIEKSTFVDVLKYTDIVIFNSKGKLMKSYIPISTIK